MTDRGVTEIEQPRSVGRIGDDAVRVERLLRVAGIREGAVHVPRPRRGIEPAK